MVLVMILGAFYLVIRASLDSLVCPAHNCCLFYPVVSYSISSYVLSRELCKKSPCAPVPR